MEKISFYAKNLILGLKQKGERVCCAESCTGGMITAALTEIPGSSSVLSRGFVTYSNQSKIDMLGVKLKTLELHGAVSGQTVSEMASGAITASNGEADYAIAVSGVAGPDGGNKEKPVGLVYIGIKINNKNYIFKKIYKGNRLDIQRRTRDFIFRKINKLI